MPGVSIGDHSVIGAGSVVTKDIPSDVIAVGNPCRVMREINEHDRKYYFREWEIPWEELEKNGETAKRFSVFCRYKQKQEGE